MSQPILRNALLPAALAAFTAAACSSNAPTASPSGAAPSTAIADAPPSPSAGAKTPDGAPVAPATEAPSKPLPSPLAVGPLPVYLVKAIDWLVEAQQPSGGFGAGSHSAQNIRDPRAVSADPGTTAFTTMALLRAGHTPLHGRHREASRRAVEFLLGLVEQSPDDGPSITDIQGTQPQAKMGRYVDTALVAQLFTRLLPEVEADAVLAGRVRKGLEKCVTKIAQSQSADGSWQGGSWAPVLQSSLMCNALEMAQAHGMKVDEKALDRAREYQKAQVDAGSGAVATSAAAGVALYAVAGNLRASASQAKAADDAVKVAKAEGKLPQEAEVDVESLQKLGYTGGQAQTLFDAYRLDEGGRAKLKDDSVLSGFGNNGGEEYLSYMMASESLVIRGGDEWPEWREKMGKRFEKIQDANGSWSGHHCITSPVFCTSAVVLSMTADRDARSLQEAARLAAR